MEDETKPDDDQKAAIADLHARVIALESELKALKSATAFIASPPPTPKQ